MKVATKRRAEVMRKGGKSIKEIARALGVSQSTVSRWCIDIKLTKHQREILDYRRREAGIKALAPWIKKNRDQKQTDIALQAQAGKSDVGAVMDRDRLFLGLGLYWGEGYKRGSQECGFTNSDPKIIRAILFWFTEHYDIPITDIIARLTINHRHKAMTKELVRWWSEETGIPPLQFGESSYIRSYTASTLPAETYRGTLRIKVRRGTSLRRRILGSIEEIARQIDSRN